jgi:hypothetical protein
MAKNKDNNSSGYALGTINYILLVIGLVIIVIGFILMIGGKSDDPKIFNENELFSNRRIIIAPVIVLFGFMFEIWAIMKKPKK